MSDQDPRKLKGFETPRDKYRNQRRDEMTQEDSLLIEAYGKKGAALRKTAKVFGEADARMHHKEASDSSFVDKAKERIKHPIRSIKNLFD